MADVDFAVVNGNYAVDAGILDTVLASEASDSEAADLYANVVCVKEGNENSEAVQALVKVLTSDKIRDYINTQYNGVFVPVF